MVRPESEGASGAVHRPCLYRGTVLHERSAPRRNRFRYGLYFVFLPIDRFEEATRDARLLSSDRPNLFSVWQRDHGPRDGSPLRPWIEAELGRAGIDLEGGPVMLLAFPRVLGARFFPVSFWYCHHADGSLKAVLAEVHNTFRENHNYLVHAAGEPLTAAIHPVARKVFYVSPFMPVEGEYRFNLSLPDARLTVGVNEKVQGAQRLVAAVDLERRELTDGQLLRVLARFGPMSVRAVSLILWQALRLKLKGLAVYPRPAPPEELTSL